MSRINKIKRGRTEDDGKMKENPDHPFWKLESGCGLLKPFWFMVHEGCLETALFVVYFIMPHRLRAFCQESHSAKTNYRVNTALKCVGHSTSLFTFSSKQLRHPFMDWFSSQKPPRLMFICFETGMHFMLKNMDTGFKEKNKAWFERQKVWSHLHIANRISIHSREKPGLQKNVPKKKKANNDNGLKSKHWKALHRCSRS